MSKGGEKQNKILWAPWRVTYIERGGRRGCIFCEAHAEGQDPKNLILWRGDGVFVMMNRYPYAYGHLLICPVRHVRDLEGLSTQEAHGLMKAVRGAVRVLNRCLTPEGFNVGVNLGKAAGAGYEDHLHVHIVPRWNGDFNYMPVIGDTLIISEYLDETYEKIREAFKLIGTEPCS